MDGIPVCILSINSWTIVRACDRSLLFLLYSSHSFLSFFLDVCVNFFIFFIKEAQRWCIGICFIEDIFFPNGAILIQVLLCPSNSSEVISDMCSNSCTYSIISIYSRILALLTIGSSKWWILPIKCYGISNSCLQNYVINSRFVCI